MGIILGLKSKKIKYITIASLDQPFKMQCGAKLNHAELAYETYGSLNREKSNVLLISHALTGDSHVGTHPDEPDNIGWWHDFLGPGLIFDTSKYFIICSNVKEDAWEAQVQLPSIIKPTNNMALIFL